MESAALSSPENRPDAAAGADARAAETADTRPASTIYGSLRGRALRLELSRLAGQIRPSWRGWIHTGAFPLAVIGGLALIILSPTIASRLAAAVFTLTGMMLFGTSAVYHRGRWRMRVRLLLRRLDHANIFLIIAGTYTPLAVLMLEPRGTAILLTIMWTGAILGVIFRIVWTTAPRWLFVPVYVGIGVTGVGYVPGIWQANLAVAILVIVGGALYIAGAVIYGIKRPDPAPRVFGYHEIFHTLTVLGFGCHLAALLVAAVSMSPEL